MENGKGILPDLNEEYVEDVTPLRTVPPVLVNGELRLGFLPAGEEPYTSLGDEAGPSGTKSGRKKWKESARLVAVQPRFNNIITKEDKENGNRALVSRVLMYYDATRRRLRQKKNADGDNTVTLNFLGLHTNKERRIGVVPGVDVGDIFFCWGEMDVVGLHKAPIAFDELESTFDGEKHSVVINVVDTGANADKDQNPHSLVVTGYGGTARYGQPSDQKLTKWNFKLHNTMRFGSVVRVVRSVKDEKRRLGKIYIYDGLYNVMDMRDKKNEAGFMVYKFLLVRHPDEKPAFGVWRAIEDWKKGVTVRPNLILEDLSYGAEKLKVYLVNEVDGEEGPTNFSYMASIQQSTMDVELKFSLCSCERRSCGRGGDCLCIESNAGEIPYIQKGLLVTRRPMIYECGESCVCSAICKNKIIKAGLKFTMEVFKTRACGWGLRSWDPIRAGSFICEFAGEVVQYSDADDDYVFDTSRMYNTFQWNYIPEIVGEDASARINEDFTISNQIMISSKRAGNVARFMNHGCTPNVLWQPISREKGGQLLIHIGFFAIKHIPPMTELRYDYGTFGGGEGRKKCTCGSEDCRGTFG